jgi:hypothetical protein
VVELMQLQSTSFYFHAAPFDVYAQQQQSVSCSEDLFNDVFSFRSGTAFSVMAVMYN